MRAKAIGLLGGACQVCGARGSELNWLEIHHRDGTTGPDTKKERDNWYDTLKKAIANPSSFRLLCRFHHLQHHIVEMKKEGRTEPRTPMEVRAAMAIERRDGMAEAWEERKRSLEAHRF